MKFYNLQPQHKQSGFTLVEVSIVLVIIGLIVGGVLVGQDLISAATTRSQISQIESYQVAVNTFKVKYGYLPGDMPEPHASNFGFTPRGQYSGQGDGNGVLEGNFNNTPGGVSWNVFNGGETVVFFVDLSAAKLIDQTFTYGSSTVNYSPITANSTPSINSFFPKAKFSGQNLYAYKMGNDNYFSISNIYNISPGGGGGITISASSFSVNQANNMDKKLDDGLPQSGKVLASTCLSCVSGLCMSYDYLWADPDIWGAISFTTILTPYTSAKAATSTSCYDNGNVAGAVQKYSVGINGGNGINCSLSFKFQ